MAIPSITYSDITPRTQIQAYRELLKDALPTLVTERLGQTKMFEKNKGMTVIFRRYTKFAPVTTALAEGVPPAASKPTLVDVSTTVQQYGAWMGITDVVMDTHEDKVFTEFRPMQSQQIKETSEYHNIVCLKGGTAVFYANGTARTDVNTPIEHGDLKLIVRSLEGADADKFTRILKAGSGIDTSPVSESYYALGHTDLKPDVLALPSFTEVHHYASNDSMAGEVGQCYNCRFVLTTMFTEWADGGGVKDGSGTLMLSTSGVKADVYPVIFLATNAWGIVPLRGIDSGQVLVANPKAMKGDELAQNGSIGWKIYHAAVILNDAMMARLECAATANPN
jgi:N4-gp56 family major capsid protein